MRNGSACTQLRNIVTSGIFPRSIGSCAQTFSPSVRVQMSSNDERPTTSTTGPPDDGPATTNHTNNRRGQKRNICDFKRYDGGEREITFRNDWGIMGQRSEAKEVLFFEWSHRRLGVEMHREFTTTSSVTTASTGSTNRGTSILIWIILLNHLKEKSDGVEG